MGDDQGFILIGAGLPRTGTASTRAALQHLLRGDIYHMKAGIYSFPKKIWFFLSPTLFQKAKYRINWAKLYNIFPPLY